MGKSDKWVGVRNIQRIGNSLGITIPSEALKELNLCEGDKFILILNREKKAIILFPAKERTVKLNGHDKEIGFYFRIPQKLLEELTKDK